VFKNSSGRHKKNRPVYLCSRTLFETCMHRCSSCIESRLGTLPASCICLSNRKQVRLGSRAVQWPLGQLLSHLDTWVLVGIYMQAIFSPDQNYACREDDCRASSRSPFFFPFVCLPADDHFLFLAFSFSTFQSEGIRDAFVDTRESAT